MRDPYRDLSRDDHIIARPRQVFDRLWHALGAQLRHPSGPVGSLVGWLMALVNDEPNLLAIDALDLGPRDSVLELGFGPGWSLRTIAERARGARVYGVDQSARMLEQAKRMNEAAVSSGRMVLVQGSFSPLPWIDEMFDRCCWLTSSISSISMAGIFQKFIACCDPVAALSSTLPRGTRCKNGRLLVPKTIESMAAMSFSIFSSMVDFSHQT